ncbi:ankyrin repeat, PH and SEC7 domain containing protein secG [Trichonephila clavata]|uniref:Ankyrin repeat, PH and SEC7 domain containing protein secG n=1 Tax=Trichonephila clavata TaxID=2740835 RepID=A0A8X6HPT7_TRICU|nr:ankyrin repeat, PH and SEC7 domain containing protein secG [Trichonephila clavata]
MDKRDALGRGIYEMVEEYNLEDVANLLRRFHKKMHNFKHVLDMIQRDGGSRSTSEIPQEYMDILASIAEESGTE